MAAHCKQCGKDYPSRYHLITHTLCGECFEKLSEEEKRSVIKSVESLTKEGPSERFIDGNRLECPICGHDEFWTRKTLMNTPGLTFLGVEWANTQARNYVCDRCGYVVWFMREGIAEEA